VSLKLHKGKRAIVVDIDGVIRNITKPLCEKGGVDYDTVTDAQLTTLFEEGLPATPRKELRKLYKNAPVFDGAIEWLKKMAQEKDTDVLILSASGFSKESRKGTYNFIAKHKLQYHRVFLVEGTSDKITFIRRWSEQYDSVIVIDDYDKVLDNAPNSVFKVKIRRKGYESEGEKSRYDIVCDALADVELEK